MFPDGLVEDLLDFLAALQCRGEYLGIVIEMETLRHLHEGDFAGIGQSSDSQCGAPADLLQVRDVHQGNAVVSQRGSAGAHVLLQVDSGVDEGESRCIDRRTQIPAVRLKHFNEDIDLGLGIQFRLNGRAQGLSNVYGHLLTLPVSTRPVLSFACRKCGHAVLAVYHRLLVVPFLPGGLKWREYTNRDGFLCQSFPLWLT